MKKRLTAILLSIAVILALSSCSSSRSIALNIEGAEITAGIYTYYYDYVSGNREKFGMSEEDDENSVIDKTNTLLKEYVAVNSISKKLGVSLSYDLKAQAANDTDSNWDIFGSYYSKIGVTKQDLNKVFVNSALKSALLDYYYGENSKVKPTKTEKLKEAFSEKYVGINVIAASLTTTDNLGNTVDIDQYELTNIRNVFSDMRDRLNGGTDIDSVYSDYITNLDLVGTQSLETYVMTESSVGYGEDFFGKISSLRYNTALVYEYEGSIYLFYRIDISSDELGYFVTYKNSILEELHLSDLEKKIGKEAEKYEITKEHSGVIKKIRKTVNENNL